MEESITITVERSPLDTSSISSPASDGAHDRSSTTSSSDSSGPSPVPELKYSDISDDEIPPPPTVPHPDVLRRLCELTELPEYKFARPHAPVPSALLTLVHRDCSRRIPAIMRKLQENASTVGNSASFQAMLVAHRRNITGLIRTVRTTAVRYLKNSEVSKSELDTIKFALFKRLSVWRDQVDSVIQISERQSGWSEERRQMLWRRLLAASRWRMAALQIRDTFSDRDILDIKHE